MFILASFLFVSFTSKRDRMIYRYVFTCTKIKMSFVIKPNITGKKATEVLLFLFLIFHVCTCIICLCSLGYLRYIGAVCVWAVAL